MILLVGFLRSLFIHRETLILENLALRQQLAMYKRTSKRPCLRMYDRAFWVGLSKLWRKWSTTLVIVTAASQGILDRGRCNCNAAELRSELHTPHRAARFTLIRSSLALIRAA